MRDLLHSLLPRHASPNLHRTNLGCLGSCHCWSLSSVGRHQDHSVPFFDILFCCLCVMAAWHQTALLAATHLWLASCSQEWPLLHSAVGQQCSKSHHTLGAVLHELHGLDQACPGWRSSLVPHCQFPGSEERPLSLSWVEVLFGPSLPVPWK